MHPTNQMKNHFSFFNGNIHYLLRAGKIQYLCLIIVVEYTIISERCEYKIMVASCVVEKQNEKLSRLLGVDEVVGPTANTYMPIVVFK